MPLIPKNCLLTCILLLAVGFGCAARKEPFDPFLAKGLSLENEILVHSAKNFLRDYPAVHGDGRVNAVIEIPAGTNAKWEVKKKGVLEHDFKDGKPRIVRYLPYPVNYGMVPQTELSKSLGGDGDPLDVLVLGPFIPRGSVVPVRIVGLLKMKDQGERDDKLITVPSSGPFAAIRTVEELDKKFPGAIEILKTWFSSYKEPGKMVVGSHEGVDEATALLNQCIAAFDSKE